MNVSEISTNSNTTFEQVKKDHGLQQIIHDIVTNFLANNKGAKIHDLYDMILAEIEPPLLEAVMAKKRGNQLQAAKILGISRGTIRKKLLRYFGTKYFRLTDD